MTSRSKGKQLAVSSDESESDSEPEGVYRHTRTRTGAIPPIDYNALAHGVEVNDSHSAVAESRASNSSVEKETSAYMTGTPEETARRLEQIQKAQMDMILSQQESIDSLKQAIAQLLEDRRKSPPKKSKGKRREGESSSSEPSEETRRSAADSPKSSSQVKGDQDQGKAHAKRMSQLEQRIEALTNRKGLQEVGVVRPYPAEWDLVPYPPKFKAPTLQAFDGKGSPNQHIYYFKSQTGNVVDNDAILARLFIGTLKGLAFEWFMKLPEGSIKNWGDLEKLFLTRFFEDDSEVTMPTLLATKQRKGESVKSFVERFRNMALRCPSGMTQATLVETCRHNLQTSLLAQIGVAESRTWKAISPTR